MPQSDPARRARSPANAGAPASRWTRLSRPAPCAAPTRDPDTRPDQPAGTPATADKRRAEHAPGHIPPADDQRSATRQAPTREAPAEAEAQAPPARRNRTAPPATRGTNGSTAGPLRGDRRVGNDRLRSARPRRRRHRHARSGAKLVHIDLQRLRLRAMRE